MGRPGRHSVPQFDLDLLSEPEGSDPLRQPPDENVEDVNEDEDEDGGEGEGAGADEDVHATRRRRSKAKAAKQVRVGA